MLAQPLPYETRETQSAAIVRDRWLLAAAALLLALQISPLFYSHGDAAPYLSIARHIARGDGLQNQGSPAIWFPPGYPLLLSPLFVFGDLPLLAISVVQWVLAIALLWGIYCWARPLSREGAAWIAALTVGTSGVWIHYRRAISEIAFMAAMAWLLACIQRLCRPAATNTAWLVAAIGLTVASCLIRPVGIALAAGGCFALLGAAGRGRRSSGTEAYTITWPRAIAAGLLIAAAAAITVGAVLLREHAAAERAGAETYLSSLETVRGTSALDGLGPWLALVVSDVGRITVPFMFKCYGDIGAWCDVNMAVYVPVFVLLLSGWLRWMRRGDDPLAWSLPFYFAVLTYFRWESGARWWIPMTPAFFMCLWFALERCGRWRLDVFRVLWLLHIVAALAYWLFSDLPHNRGVDQYWPAVRGLAQGITSDRDHVVIDARLADVGALLTLDLDRHVNEWSVDAPLPDAAKWLILPADQQPPAGFAPRVNEGGCALWQREQESRSNGSRARSGPPDAHACPLIPTVRSSSWTGPPP
jgi:hypothetical protein